MRWRFFVLGCLAVMACDSKQVGSSDGTQSQGGESGKASAGSVSHAAEGGSRAAAGGRNAGAPTAPNQVDAGTPAAGGAGSKAGAGGQAAAGGQAGAGGQAAAGGQAGEGGKDAAQGGKAGAGGQDAQGGKGGQGGGAAGSSGAAAGGGGVSAGSAGERCGTRGGVVMCAAAEFCNFEPDKECGATDRGGKCEAKPTSCDDMAEPVCGCDNHSYDNACEAHKAGVSVQRAGLCTSEDCDAAGGFIVTSDGASIPKCPAQEPSFPIRGGREQTLCCLRASRTGQTCGGIASLECGGNEFCNYEKSAGGQGCDGQIADAAGVCQARPSACTREYRPVCGCDHHSYGNACVAHSNGAGVMHEGECTVAECQRVGGRVEVGSGTGPMCKTGERDFGTVAPEGNQIPIEGQICCVP